MRYRCDTEVCCARQIEFDVEEGDVVRDIEFMGGCNGNLRMISKLLDGMTLDQIVEKCRGNMCRNKGTSCADQFAKACEAVKQQRAEQ